MLRRILFSAWLVCLVAIRFPATAATGRPNILVILTDDQGFADMGCYGARDLRTPNMDRLVGEGMRFNSFRASCTVCSPTRAALLTGCYPDRVGVPGVIRTHPDDSWGYLRRSAVLLPKALKSAGYDTAIIGKWHLGLESPNTPNERGFDEFHGFLGDMMDDYWTHRRFGNNYMRHNQEVIDPEGHATDLFTTWAGNYLRSRQGRQEPFFLYLAYNAPHGPIQPPPDWLERVKQRESGITDHRARIVALIEQLDDSIGKVLAALEESGMADNTLVILTSDNGGDLRAGANNSPWRAGKGTKYEGGLRVPFTARWPGHIEPGSHSDENAVTMDIFPTALEAAGAGPVAGIDGVSLLPLLTGRESSLPARELYFVRREGGLAFGGKTIEALVRGDWKLVHNTPFMPLELFNLKDDPYEQTDLAPTRREIVSDLDKALRRHIQLGGSTPWQPPETP